MKNSIRVVLNILPAVSLLAATLTVRAQNTAFTYQGLLNFGGSPAAGSYDLTFQLFNSPTNAVGSMLALTNTVVSNGLFTVSLDFGAGVFTGTNYWLQIGARTNGSSAFTNLAPLLPITPTPYAIAAAGLVGGGSFNTISNTSTSTISGGVGNSIQQTATNSIIAGGDNNTIGTNSFESTIGGGGSVGAGSGNRIQSGANDSVIGGGSGNIVGSNAFESVIAGGDGNTIAGNAFESTIAGGGIFGSKLLAGLNFSNNQETMTVAGNMIDAGANDSFIGGGAANYIGNNASYSFIGGGDYNTIASNAYESVIVGGGSDMGGSGGTNGNTIDAGAVDSFIGGGIGNYIGADAGVCAIVGGEFNTINNNVSFIAGGSQNTINAQASFIAGCDNGIDIISDFSAIAGGENNQIQNYCPWSFIAGGDGNNCTGPNAFAAGENATASKNCLVWSDGSARTTSTTSNQFMVRASGGAIFYSSSGNNAGVSLAAGGGSWANLSDRNAKNDFAPVATRQVLDKVAGLPITEWSYKTEQGVRHIGPMAQDFYAAFGVGEDDRHVTSVDEEGVALAAIQGLNQKVEEQARELKSKDAAIQALEERLEERLERLESKMAHSPNE